MNIPNLLSLFRIILVPIFCIVFLSDSPNAYLVAMCIFLLAGLTDVVDGRIARKYNQVTLLGRVLDPLADKLMVFCALLCLTVRDIVPIWVVVLFFVKEASQGLSGVLLMHRINDMPPANMLGKTGTVLFYGVIVAVTLIPMSEIIKTGLLVLAFVVIFAAFLTYVVRGLRLMHANPKPSTDAK